MPITFACTCGRMLTVKAPSSARKVKCPQCGQKFAFPKSAPTGQAKSADAKTAIKLPWFKPTGLAQTPRTIKDGLRGGLKAIGVLLGLVAIALAGWYALPQLQALATSGKAKSAKVVAPPPVSELEQRAVAAKNLQKIHAALAAYRRKHGTLPPPVVGAGLSWRVALLPHLGEDGLARRFRMNESWDSPHNIQLLPMMPKVFAPSTALRVQAYATLYQAIIGPGTAFTGEGFDTSKGLLVAEGSREVLWTRPADLPFESDYGLELGAQFGGIFLAVGADGVVHTPPRDLDMTGMRSLVAGK